MRQRKAKRDEYLAVGGDLFARELEKLFVRSAAGERGQAELGSNEELANPLHRQNFARMGGPIYGRIVYSMPYVGWYRVLLDDLNGDAPCCRLSETSLLPFGVRDTSPFSAGQGVVIWWPPEGRHGFILGAVPPKIEDGALVHPDWISQGSNCGFKREAYYHELFDLVSDDAGATDWSNNRPLDGLSSGEWGRLADTGVGLHIDLFMAFLRADETCGLWAFYLDRLLRLAGHNMDVRTAISELLIRDDGGEGLHFGGFSPYAWEALGAFDFGDQIHREVPDIDVQYNLPYGKFEPALDKQQPFYRLEEFRGYLGQGGMRQVMAPPISKGVNTYDNQQPRIGLLREQVSLDGAYALESAHSVSLVKRVLIPIPKRIRLPEDPNGDRHSDLAGEYVAAGLHGQGDNHIITSLKATGVLPNMQEVAAVTDFAAHAFEWKGLHAFYYHKHDFHLPEQDELGQFTSLQFPPSFSLLSQQQWLPSPSAREVLIDHRYGMVDYFETTAGVYLLPRGGVVIRGGGNEEIRMAGGSVQISCPGDVWLQPGRNVNILAADDCNIKAHKSIDLTTTQQDIRLKAQHNVQVLAGNDQVGGVLIESRSPAPVYDFDKDGEAVQHGGILLIAPKSEVVSWGKNIYMRTGGGRVEEGLITLDAAKGQQDVYTICRSKINHCELAKIDTFPVEGEKDVANYYSAINAQIHTPLQCDGHLVLTKGGLLMKGYIAVVGGHIGTEYAQQYNFFVGWLTGKSLSDAKQALQQTLDSISEFKGAMTANYSQGVEGFWYADKRPGNEAVMEKGRFSLRSDEQMNTTDWELPENYWQQTARMTGQAFGAWEEKVVEGNEGEQQPYPGMLRWEGDNLMQIDLQLHDPKTGRDVRRDTGLYEEPEFKDWTRAAPQEAYPIIVP